VAKGAGRLVGNERSTGGHPRPWELTIEEAFRLSPPLPLGGVWLTGPRDVLGRSFAPALESFGIPWHTSEGSGEEHRVLVAVQSNVEEARALNRKIVTRGIEAFFVLVGAEAVYTGPWVVPDGPCLECVLSRSMTPITLSEPTGREELANALLQSPFMHQYAVYVAARVWSYAHLGERHAFEIIRWHPISGQQERAKVLKSPWCSVCG
jgi:hypothetical protein